ncbi:protein bicaudal D homolog 1-like isoform X2 [Thalassophryne amazonica]|uniref:protein bicaudal D homolog 1-like isoform X2 n=1 Tax=Thalassophryne amazonica TaxID=390379 RepID=UPI0014712B4A|nr:protein bicaudal D homolog 1-like isoform X2 [Thalassophryne amazonica]
MAAGAAGCGEEADQCRSEVDRLSRELAEAHREKIRAAECGLVVLEENQNLKQQCAELEAEQEALRAELEELQKAFGHAYSTQRKVAQDGESTEETLLQESASKDAYYQGRLIQLQSELINSRASLANAQADNEHLSAILQEVQKRNDVLELQHSRMQEEIREYKLRESQLLQDCSELEEENISLQKLVSTLKHNQVEYEGLKHEMKVLEEEAELLSSQLQEALRLKNISEAHLEEVLESLKNEREHKNHLRRELVHHLSQCGVAYSGTALLTFSSTPPSGAATPTSVFSPNAEEPPRCNSLLHGGAGAVLMSRVNRERSMSARTQEGSPTLNLSSEISLTEIQILKQQLMTVENEKAALMSSLQPSQSHVRHRQESLMEQHEEVAEPVPTRALLAEEAPTDPQREEQETETSTNSLESLQVKYHMVVTEGMELKAELKALRERLAQREEEQPRGGTPLPKVECQLASLEKRYQEGCEKICSLELALQERSAAASNIQKALNAAQDQLMMVSEELAQFYHHICLCNNEMPNHVMLDYYRQGRGIRALSASLKAACSDTNRVLLTPRLARHLAVTADQPQSPSESPSKESLSGQRTAEDMQVASEPPCSPPTCPASTSASSSSSSSSPSELQRDPMNISNLSAIIKDQLQHLHGAVDRCLQLCRHRAAGPLLEDKESCAEEMLKLRSLLSTKREQIVTLRLILKANKQTAEGALTNLKSKYEAEKSMVTNTMKKLRNELKALKEDAATFSSLRAIFATRCDEYVTQLDEMQRQLAAAEDEKKTLNSLLRMAIQQKVALTQRLDDLAFDQEQTHHTHSGRLTRLKSSKVTPPASASASNLAEESTISSPHSSSLTSPKSVVPEDPGAAPFSPASVSAAGAASSPAVTSLTSQIHPRRLSSPTESPTSPSVCSPPSTLLRPAHFQGTLAVRPFQVDSHSFSSNTLPLNTSRLCAPPLHRSSSPFTARSLQPGSAPSPSYCSRVMDFRRFMWSPMLQTQSTSSVSHSSVLHTPSYHSSFSPLTPSSSYRSSVGRPAHCMPPRHYCSSHPRH